MRILKFPLIWAHPFDPLAPVRYEVLQRRDYLVVLGSLDAVLSCDDLRHIDRRSRKLDDVTWALLRAWNLMCFHIAVYNYVLRTWINTLQVSIEQLDLLQELFVDDFPLVRLGELTHVLVDRKHRLQYLVEQHLNGLQHAVSFLRVDRAKIYQLKMIKWFKRLTVLLGFTCCSHVFTVKIKLVVIRTNFGDLGILDLLLVARSSEVDQLSRQRLVTSGGCKQTKHHLTLAVTGVKAPSLYRGMKVSNNRSFYTVVRTVTVYMHIAQVVLNHLHIRVTRLVGRRRWDIGSHQLWRNSTSSPSSKDRRNINLSEEKSRHEKKSLPVLNYLLWVKNEFLYIFIFDSEMQSNHSHDVFVSVSDFHASMFSFFSSFCLKFPIHSSKYIGKTS